MLPEKALLREEKTMTKIELAFQKAQDMNSLYTISKELKEAGHDVAAVNTALAARRKVLLHKAQDSIRKVLKKTVFTIPNTGNENCYTQFSFKNTGSSEGRLSIEGGNTFVWS